MPSGWDSLPLGEVVTYKKGFAFKSDNYKSSGKRIIRISDTTASGVKNESPVFVDPDKSLEDFELNPRDIILSTVGSRPPLYDSMVGKAIKIPPDIVGAYLNQNLVKLIPDEKIDRDFLFFKLKEPRFISYISTLVRGNANQVSITLDELFNYQLLLPPKGEQEKISKILSAWDEAIEKLESIIEKEIVFKETVVKSLMSNIKEEANTEFKKLSDVCKKITAGGTPSTNKPEYWGGDIPWMSSGEINLKFVKAVEGRITQAGLDNSSTKIIPKNSVLVALAGQGKTRGTVAVSEIDLCTNQSLAALIVSDQISHLYLYYNLDTRYDELRRLSTGDGGRGGLNLKIIGDIVLPIPPMEIQKKIANAAKSLDLRIELLNRNKIQIQLQKQGLMQQLLTGKKRVKV